MTENVYEYAKILFNYNEKKYKKWSETLIYYIETEQFKKALKKISENPLPENKPYTTVNLAGYIQNNLDKMNYLRYNNNGDYIGSGMIESGNKNVIQKRMKQSGMRWSVSGAQYMAVLRAKHESNAWNDVVDHIIGRDKAA